MDDDEDDIHERLEQLEATVADQQATIEQLTETPAVGRRSVVASLLGAGAVGGLAGWGSQSARAASGPAGQVGTGEEPVDGFLWDLDVQGQVTSDLPMDGNDVTGVGALEAERASIGNVAASAALTETDQSLPHDTWTQIELDSIEDEDDGIVNVDLDNDRIEFLESGTYMVILQFTVVADSGWETGDLLRCTAGFTGPLPDRNRRMNKIGDGTETNIWVTYVKVNENDTINMSVRHEAADNESKTISASNQDTAIQVVMLG